MAEALVLPPAAPVAAGVAAGAAVRCHRCSRVHHLFAGPERALRPGDVEVLLFYTCANKTFLGAVDGRLLPGVEGLPPGAGP